MVFKWIVDNDKNLCYTLSFSKHICFMKGKCLKYDTIILFIDLNLLKEIVAAIW